MRTLQNQTLLYDVDCPLCNLYTSGFIKAKMLDVNGRKAYHELSIEEQNFVDFEKAKNEIALINTENNTVIYGIDSLLKVIGYSMPWVAKVGNLKPIKYALKKLYSFISYNRKVIIPIKETSNLTLQCVPSFNYKYRYTYILFATIVTSLVLTKFSDAIDIIPKSNYLRESLIAFGQIVFQSIFILNLSSQRRVTYLGHLMTISLLGSLILIPLLITNSIFNLPKEALLTWFGLTVGYMFYEHYRRMKLVKLTKYLSLTWVIYRVLILIVILNF